MISPGDEIKVELEKRGWVQEDLARVLGRPLSRVNDIIQGKQSLTAELALELATVFDQEASRWMMLEAKYRLAQLKNDPSELKRRARIYELGPVKEMAKRGWIAQTETTEALEREVLQYFDLQSLEDVPSIHGAMRKSGRELGASSPQTAWAFRVRQLARAIPSTAVGVYSESKLVECKQELRRLAAFSAEVRKAPAVLMSFGIRFVVVEGLSGAKMDGFATWIDEQSPVIGMSLKRDRLDSFWFTLGHELIHIEHRDLAPIDGGVASHDEVDLEVKPPMERRADEEGAAMFISADKLDSFIRRVGPLYSMDRINQFANTIKIHPSIIVGQLQHRREIGFDKFSKAATPVRNFITNNAITDGWSKSINPGALL